MFSRSFEVVRPPLLELGAVVAVSLGFAASFGFNYGIGNQASYLIPSLRVLDPEMFRNDWYATKTTQYHPAFTELAALLIALDRQGWAVALGLTLVVAAGTASLYFLLRAVGGRRLALPSFLLLVTFAFLTRTAGPAMTYVFDRTLQPSTLGSAAFLGAAACFVSERFLASGVLLALGGLFHANLLTLLLPAFALAHTSLGRQGLGSRWLRGLALPVLVLVGFLPLLVRAVTSDSDADFARHVYLYVRAPHHFAIADRAREFLPLLGWQILAYAAAAPWMRDAADAKAFRRLGALILGLAVVVWIGALAALVSQRAATLFSWRLGAHVELLLQACTASAVVRVTSDRTPFSRYGRRGIALTIFGVALLVYGYASLGRIALVKLLAIVIAGMVSVLIVRARESAPRGRLGWVSGLRSGSGFALLTGAAGILLIGFALRPMLRIPDQSNLLQRGQQDEVSLAAWMRERTPKDAVFLTPPDDEFIRFLGERAIVVDWKAVPALPSEILDWHRRIQDVTGRMELRGPEDLRGYWGLDERRLVPLRARYGVRYVVVRREHEHALGKYQRAFENARFVVFDVREVGE
jgi:hypothetical protein